MEKHKHKIKTVSETDWIYEPDMKTYRASFCLSRQRRTREEQWRSRPLSWPPARTTACHWLLWTVKKKEGDSWRLILHKSSLTLPQPALQTAVSSFDNADLLYTMTNASACLLSQANGCWCKQLMSFSFFIHSFRMSSIQIAFAPLKFCCGIRAVLATSLQQRQL